MFDKVLNICQIYEKISFLFSHVQKSFKVALYFNHMLLHGIRKKEEFAEECQAVLQLQIIFRDIVAQWWYFDNLLKSHCFIFHFDINHNSTSCMLIWWCFRRQDTCICIMFTKRKISWMEHFKISLSS